MTDPFPSPNPSDVVDRLLAVLADDATPAEYREVMLAAARVIAQQGRDLDSLWQDWMVRLREDAS